MSDTNWQCKEGDPFKADITYRLRNNYAQELCLNAMREPTIYAEAAGHIEAQQQRIEALERELAEASKDAARYRWLRDLPLKHTRNIGGEIHFSFAVSNPEPNQWCISSIRGVKMSAAIDAAMKEQA